MKDLLQFFAYEHLPPHLQTVSKPFGDLARELATLLPVNPESAAALRKLLEAKDCAVRAVLFKQPEPAPISIDVRGSVARLSELIAADRAAFDKAVIGAIQNGRATNLLL